MAYSPVLGSPITNTRLRSPAHISDSSGMCAVCAADCPGLCEIGLSAIRGPEAILPFAADRNQFASEKSYPLDFSHFSINGRVFGAVGCPQDPHRATFPNVDIATWLGLRNKVELKAPLILPAMAKLNWQDYMGGAALAGVPAVIGEDVVTKDAGLALEHGKVVASPLIDAMVAAFRKYHRGHGDVILQANYDDDSQGVLDYAITRLGVKSVELKLGQAAKCIQGMAQVPRIEDAIAYRERGYIVHPDPSDPRIAEDYAKGVGPIFVRIGKLPMWSPEDLAARVAQLRALGAERVCLKTGPFAPRDLVTILEVASEAGVDLVTLDGAGGGTGSSPVRMMHEWGIPPVPLECIVHRILQKLDRGGRPLPQIAMAGGFAMEDHVFKGLALGAPYVSLIAIGRAAMAAACVGKLVGEALRAGSPPKEYTRFGSRVDEVFAGMRVLRAELGTEAAEIPTGAIGVFSYLERVSVGLRQLMALNRKFNLRSIGREDIVPLTEAAAKTTGLPTYGDLLDREL